MFNISSYLQKFQKMESPGDSEKKAAEKAISEIVGVSLERKTMNVINGVLYLTVSSAVKNEIYMNKRGILKKIEETLGENKVKDIR